MKASERISLNDDSLIASHAENIQRYEFALQYSKGMHVLDAGCGTGYGTHFIAANGAKSALGLDISQVAINEAVAHYRLTNLRYDCADIENLEGTIGTNAQFDVVLNFENLAHLRHPKRMICGVASILPKGGRLILSTPNGEISPIDDKGKPLYEFHHRVFNANEVETLIFPQFKHLTIYGQWLTYAGMLRKLRGKQLFEQLCEAYYNPMSRIGRGLKRLAGKVVAGPPLFTAAADSFAGDYVIGLLEPLEPNLLPWAPTTLIAVCEK